MKSTRWSIVGAVLGTAVLLLLAACGGEDGSDPGGGGATGAEFDRAFIDAMVPHHESAIEMAEAAKEAGLTQEELIEVADAILATQQQEIDRMKEWRAEWFGSSAIDPEGAAGLGMSTEQMGMEHDADVLLRSGDVDTDFAQMMITHHQGAIDMARLALERAEHEELQELAGAIIEAQEGEISVLRPHASGMHHE
jgi:uncharacterized protein (DUF305 family)